MFFPSVQLYDISNMIQIQHQITFLFMIIPNNHKFPFNGDNNKKYMSKDMSFMADNDKTDNIIKRYMTALALTVIILSVASYILINKTHLIEVSYGIGDSMYPTNRNGCIDISVTKIKDIKRNDIVDAIQPESGHDITKRVVAVEGDNIKIKNGKLYINDKEDDSEFSKKADYSWCDEIDITLEEGYYFLMGDNRNVSIDSRMYGPVTKNYIKGKQIISIY